MRYTGISASTAGVRHVATRFLVVVGVLLAFLASGCTSVPMASIQDDTQAKAFAVPSDKASIYVYRNESLGGAVPMTIALDGKVAGQSAMKTYFLFVVDPGPHELSSITENTSTLRLVAEEGKAYFVWQEVKWGLWMARSQLQQVDEAAGRAGVAECKRAQSGL